MAKVGMTHTLEEALRLPTAQHSPPVTSDRSPRVAVIVLNWNGRDDTLQCLESLARVEYSDYDVIVVDNGSADGSVAAIRDRFPDVSVLETGANLGYAEGNNVGMRTALARGAECVLLLNNDTVVDPGLLAELAAAAAQWPEAGVFGAKIYHYTERDRVWYAGARWNAQRLRFDLITNESTYGHASGQVVETDYACGCALFVRKCVLERIGLLEPKYFLTYEETDFCYRARRNGFKVVFVPRAFLWHKISASFGGQESPLVSYFMARNYLLWSERNLPPSELRAARRRALYDLKVRLLPASPFTAGWKTLDPAVFVAALTKFRSESAVLWRNPATWGMFWGTLHYFLRRFGPAPAFVRRLGTR